MIEIVTIFFRIFSKLKRMGNIASAKKEGLKIGPGTILVGDQSFGSEPFLIEIGRDCLITDGVRFITHDGAIQVPLIAAGYGIKDVYSKKSTFNRIKIEDNVFIGVSTIILPGTTIGCNSIIAAGSVVKGEFPTNTVIGGNPAKTISTLAEYLGKNEKKIIKLENKSNRTLEILKWID
jgi:acetyltransferase-like isoleucine patch superfamily enzyme